MNEPKAIKWTFNGTLWKASIGGGLLNLVVFASPFNDPNARWYAQVNGVQGKRQPELFDTADEAKLWAEHRASVYVKQMAEELQASFMSAESEASE